MSDRAEKIVAIECLLAIVLSVSGSAVFVALDLSGQAAGYDHGYYFNLINLFIFFAGIPFLFCAADLAMRKDLPLKKIVASDCLAALIASWKSGVVIPVGRESRLFMPKPSSQPKLPPD